MRTRWAGAWRLPMPRISRPRSIQRARPTGPIASPFSRASMRAHTRMSPSSVSLKVRSSAVRASRGSLRAVARGSVASSGGQVTATGWLLHSRGSSPASIAARSKPRTRIANHTSIGSSRVCDSSALPAATISGQIGRSVTFGLQPARTSRAPRDHRARVMSLLPLLRGRAGGRRGGPERRRRRGRPGRGASERSRPRRRRRSTRSAPRSGATGRRRGSASRR
jgi:hypothetical protein